MDSLDSLERPRTNQAQIQYQCLLWLLNVLSFLKKDCNYLGIVYFFTLSTIPFTFRLLSVSSGPDDNVIITFLYEGKH